MEAEGPGQAGLPLQGVEVYSFSSHLLGRLVDYLDYFFLSHTPLTA